MMSIKTIVIFLFCLFLFSIFSPSIVPQSSLGLKTTIFHSNTSALDTCEKYIPNTGASSQNDTIIEIIQQINTSILYKYLENLTAFGPRVTGSQACISAGEYIYNQFANHSLSVRYHNWSYEDYEGSNIEATLTPKNPIDDEIYLVCAHYDSASEGIGADDDASGVAVVLAAAEIMHRYLVNKTVRFVTFSGEEQGLLGSHEYALEAIQHNDNIVAVLNVDMIGYALTKNDGNNIQVFYNEASTWLQQYTSAISQTYHISINLIVLPHLDGWWSDHRSFWNVGYDAIFYFQYNSSNLPPEEDILEYVNLTYMVKGSRLILATLAEFAQATPLPPLPQLEIEEIAGGIGATTVVKNIGLGIATNVTYTISADGGFIMTVKNSIGLIGTLNPNASQEIVITVKGIGLGFFTPLPSITVNVTSTEGVSAEKTVRAKIFFNRVIIQ